MQDMQEGAYPGKKKKSIAGGSCTCDHQAYVVRRTFLITKIGGP
jgi:hypothetical protein